MLFIGLRSAVYVSYVNPELQSWFCFVYTCGAATQRKRHQTTVSLGVIMVSYLVIYSLESCFISNTGNAQETLRRKKLLHWVAKETNQIFLLKTSSRKWICNNVLMDFSLQSVRTTKATNPKISNIPTESGFESEVSLRNWCVKLKLLSDSALFQARVREFVSVPDRRPVRGDTQTQERSRNTETAANQHVHQREEPGQLGNVRLSVLRRDAGKRVHLNNKHNESLHTDHSAVFFLLGKF